MTDGQVGSPRKVFANKSSPNINFSKMQQPKTMQSEGFLDRLLGPLLNVGLPLTKNVLRPYIKSMLITLGLAATASAADVRIHKKILVSGALEK